MHGGPGRAGGGEEMGGVRGVLHYMQRTALQGSPTTLTRGRREWITGGAELQRSRPPVPEVLRGARDRRHARHATRTVTEADVVNFAGISGDFFYAHMDDIAAKRFAVRAARGARLLRAVGRGGTVRRSGAGPVLANYGLENLRFVKPVYLGDTIQARLTCKQKTAKEIATGRCRRASSRGTSR